MVEWSFNNDSNTTEAASNVYPFRFRTRVRKANSYIVVFKIGAFNKSNDTNRG